MKRKVLVLLLLPMLFISCTDDNTIENTENSYRVLASIPLDHQNVQVYAVYGWDFSVIGLAVQDHTNVEQYCPLYLAVDEELPDGTITISVIESTKEIWLQSSWSAAKTLGIFKAGSTSCVTMDGIKPLINKPTPGFFGGNEQAFPDMPSEKVTRKITLEHIYQETKTSSETSSNWSSK